MYKKYGCWAKNSTWPLSSVLQKWKQLTKATKYKSVTLWLACFKAKVLDKVQRNYERKYKNKRTFRTKRQSTPKKLAKCSGKPHGCIYLWQARRQNTHRVLFWPSFPSLWEFVIHLAFRRVTRIYQNNAYYILRTMRILPAIKEVLQ